MKAWWVILMALAGISTATAQTVRFVLPVEGELGHDYFIVNHVDHDTTTGVVRDYRCGTRTYDGHQGTDFVLRDFRQMDSGVGVLAAADGVVFAVIDTLPDRNKVSVPERGFGNWIGVAHTGGIYSYYAHLRTGSAVVKVGDTVHASQLMAQVGSSGNSTDPHLHFEVWTADTMLLDPFAGECNSPESLWGEQPPNDTSFVMIGQGLINWLPTLDTLREHPPTQKIFTDSDSVVVLWMHMHGLRNGAVQRVDWFTPEGTLWFSYDFPAIDRDWWYYYFWTYIDRPAESGNWLVRYTYDNGGERVYNYTFQVEGTMTVEEKSHPDSAIGIRARVVDGGMVELITTSEITGTTLTATLFDLSGRQVASLFEGPVLQRFLQLPFPHVRSGLYVLRIATSKGAVAVALPVVQ